MGGGWMRPKTAVSTIAGGPSFAEVEGNAGIGEASFVHTCLASTAAECSLLVHRLALWGCISLVARSIPRIQFHVLWWRRTAPVWVGVVRLERCGNCDGSVATHATVTVMIDQDFPWRTLFGHSGDEANRPLMSAGRGVTCFPLFSLLRAGELSGPAMTLMPQPASSPLSLSQSSPAILTVKGGGAVASQG